MRLVVALLGGMAVFASGCSSSIASPAGGKGGMMYGTTAAYGYSEAELSEVTSLCSAVASCLEDRACRGGFAPTHFDGLTLESPWGKAMADGLQLYGVRRVGSEIAHHIYDADLTWATPDCRTVVKFYGL